MGPLKARLAISQFSEPSAVSAEWLADEVAPWAEYPVSPETQQAVLEAVKALRAAATHLRAAKAAL